MAGYVIGLGDRHAGNMLLHLKSAALVHIDLGVAFEQVLPVLHVYCLCTALYCLYCPYCLHYCACLLLNVCAVYRTAQSCCAV